MASKFGGGGTKCKICDKTSYPAETIVFEKISFHADCFKCTDCDKKLEGASKAAQYEEKVYCHQCFSKNGFAQKQRSVKWVKKEGTGSSAGSSKFGGGGNPCEVCGKTVYPAETVSFEKKVYHMECFNCTVCSKQTNVSNANKFEDNIICNKCFKEGGYTRKQTAKASTGKGSGTSSGAASKFGGGGTKCKVCAKTVYAAETVSFEKQAYHMECFKCQNCDKKLTPSGAEGQKFTNDEGANDVNVYCKKCWGELGLNRAKVS